MMIKDVSGRENQGASRESSTESECESTVRGARWRTVEMGDGEEPEDDSSQPRQYTGSVYKKDRDSVLERDRQKRDRELEYRGY